MARRGDAMESRYAQVYAAWRRDPEAFWRTAAEAIDWIRPPRRIFDPSSGPYGRWFPDATLNICHNALDRHADGGRGDQVALIHDSPVTGTVLRYTYAEMRDAVAALAAVLAREGVAHGDRVVIYMPMIPQAVFAMLACARLGAVHSVVFGGFAAHELAKRIDDARPKLVLTASCGLEPNRTVPYKPLLDEALRLATHRPDRCLVWRRPQAPATLVEGRDLDWAEAVAAVGDERAPCAEVEATDPLYILYTSGTTGLPKGVVRDTGGYAVALAWSMPNLYGVRPGEVFWTASDIGWVVGHSYIVYGPLIHGAATVLTRASRWARPTPAPSGASAPTTPSRPSSPPRRRSGPSARRTPRARCAASTTCRGCGRCSSRASGPIPPRSSGPRRGSACRWWTIGGRPRPAGASPATRSAWGFCR